MNRGGSSPWCDMSGVTHGQIIRRVERCLRQAGMPDRAEVWVREAYSIIIGTSPTPEAPWRALALPPPPRLSTPTNEKDRLMAVVGLAMAVVRWGDGTNPLPRLKEWRERRMLTQGELAQRAGVARATISRLERVYEPWEGARFSTIRKLAAALDVQPEELMAWSGDEGDEGKAAA